MNAEIACKKDLITGQIAVTLAGAPESILANWDILTHAISDNLNVPLEGMVAAVTGEQSRRCNEEFKKNHEVFKMEFPMKGGDDNG